MDTKKLANNIVDSLMLNNCYSEVSESKMRDIVNKYLDEVYNKKISKLSIEFDLRILSGERITKSDYNEAFDGIGQELVDTMKDLSKHSK